MASSASNAETIETPLLKVGFTATTSPMELMLQSQHVVRRHRHVSTQYHAPAAQVPYESLKRTTRDRKGVLEEYAEVMKRLESQVPFCTSVHTFGFANGRALTFGTLKVKMLNLSAGLHAEG